MKGHIVSSSIYNDPQVINVLGGTWHDWITVATKEIAEALIEEYHLNVKYQPYETVAGDWRFAIV